MPYGPSAASSTCARDIVAIGGVPYKSGKLGADQLSVFEAYGALLRRLKQSLDPQGILSPGDLGLNR